MTLKVDPATIPFEGGAGNDTIKGGENNDDIMGDAGVDTLNGDAWAMISSMVEMVETLSTVELEAMSSTAMPETIVALKDSGFGRGRCS